MNEDGCLTTNQIPARKRIHRIGLLVVSCFLLSGCNDTQATTDADHRREVGQTDIASQLPEDWEVLEWSREPASIGERTNGEITVSYRANRLH